MVRIRFCKRLAKTSRSKEIELLQKLKQLNVHLDQNPDDANLTVELERVKLDLQKISKHKTKGAKIRSRVWWYEHGERNNKYFINLEKRSHDKKHIVKLKTDQNEYIQEPNNILLEMETFYKTLYTSQISDETFEDSCSPFLNPDNIPKLNEEQQKNCEGLNTAEECLSALKMFVKNKIPGADGLTAEFYLYFCEYVAGPLINCYN